MDIYLFFKMLLKQDKIKFFTFLPFIVTTATVFPGLTLNDSGEQPQILSGISTGTSRTEKEHMVQLNYDQFVLTEIVIDHMINLY